MQRRDFITLLGGGAAAAWPLAGRAQQGEQARRIGVLMAYDESDPEAKSLVSVFTQGLSELGWSTGGNVHLEIRWAAGDVAQMQVLAKELVDVRPDVILANSTPVTAALQQATRTIPIVFVVVADPVGSGFVASLPRPGGNITGFINEEAATVGKRLELLKDIAPAVKRAAIIFNPDTAAGQGSYYLPAFEMACRSLNLEPIVAPIHSDHDIQLVIDGVGRNPGGGIVAMNDGFLFVHREQIIAAANQRKVPAVYGDATFARDGGLLGYGPDRKDIFRRAAKYGDRLLRGEKPAELPVQLPVKFNMAVNTKAAKAIGLALPATLLALADEVIE
ncbi:MAG: ABC transporter substrate-binding protein [Bradyrhizobium sp.]|nr:ABC transporter substrate-binding protein [Bradyrhizobium sp.]